MTAAHEAARQDRPPAGSRWRPRPLAVRTDPAHGGRWTSLRATSRDGSPEREWLWRHPDDAVARARAAVRPAAAFVDAGGVEECFPTVRGQPDHGDVWSRPWSGSAAGEQHVRTGALQLSRLVRDDGALTVTYTIQGPAHTPFVHAVHALLDVTPAALLHAPGARTVHLLDHPTPGAVTVAPWPAGDGTGALDHLGPDDGTATAAVLPGCGAAAVVDGSDALTLSWRIVSGDPDATCSLLLWRNLRGWPAGAPYRSIGVEPMVGTAAALDDPEPGAPASTGAAGMLRWELTLTAWSC